MHLMPDLRYALRSLARRPLFTALAVLTLALGLGANSMIFSVVDAVLFRPLPFPEPERLVRVWPDSYFSKQELAELRERVDAYDGLAAYFSWAVYGLTTDGGAESLRAAQVSPELFSTLGVPAALGQAFRPGENLEGRERIVMLSHRLWQRRFGADPAIVGQAIILDGASYRVQGVMPASFQFPQNDTEIWVPMLFVPTDTVDYTANYIQLVARLKPGVTTGEAQAEGRAAAVSIREKLAHPRTFGAASTVESLHRVMVGRVRPAMLTLLAAVGLVLLIAAANVANLLLTRAAGRSREVAVRAALGAGRGRIVRLMLVESLLLALLGGGAGLLAAVTGLETIVAFLPSGLPRLHEIAIDGRLFGFSFALTLLTGLLFGLAPALKAARPDLFVALRASAGGSGPRNSTRSSGLLVIAEVALALVLVVGAGLLIKSFWRLTQVDPGFEPNQVLSFNAILPGAEYGDYDREKTFYHQVLERLEALPGVAAAGAVHMLPVESRGFNGGFESDDHPVAAGSAAPIVNWRVVTPSYFETLEIPLLEGRGLRDADRDGLPQVALVNQTLARRFWPDSSPVGRRIHHSLEDGAELTVVGVVGDVRQHGLGAVVAPEIYRPLRQSQRRVGMAYVLRATGNPDALFSTVRSVIRDIDPTVPIAGQTMAQVLDRSVAQPRFVMMLVTLFAAVAMSLGAIGIYGVMAHDVNRRTRELGLRMALGAHRSDVLSLVLKRGLTLVAAGLMLGLGAAVALARLLASQLFEVQPIDVGLYLTVALLLATVAAVATFLPARRATSIDPLSALRHE